MAYSTESDMDLFFGSANIDEWADIDNDDNATTIANRKTEAIAVADDTIDDVLRTTALSGSLPLSTVPTRIKDLSRKLAGLWLYESRGAFDEDSEGNPIHRWMWLDKKCNQVLDDIRTGNIKTSASV